MTRARTETLPSPPPLRQVPALLAITDRRQLPGGDLAAWLAALPPGVEAVQLREKDLSDRDLLALALDARQLVPPPRRLLVNGRFDVALAADADGVHLPADALPTRVVRDRLGPQRLVGRSTHVLAEVQAAALSGADYVLFGPVFSTPSKRAAGPPRGLARLSAAARCGIPVLAVGGVTPARFAALARAGAAGAAGIRLFLDPMAAATAVEEARRVWGAW